MSRIVHAALAASTLLLLGCGPAAEPAADVARHPPLARPAGAPTDQDAERRPLRLVGVLPAPGAGSVRPSTVFRLEFDRALAVSALEPSAVRLEYLDSRLRFLVDPFEATTRSLPDEGLGRVLALDPPDLVPGERLRLTFGPELRAADGAPPLPGPDGQPLHLDFQVPELPW